MGTLQDEFPPSVALTNLLHLHLIAAFLSVGSFGKWSRFVNPIFVPANDTNRNEGEGGDALTALPTGDWRSAPGLTPTALLHQAGTLTEPSASQGRKEIVIFFSAGQSECAGELTMPSIL